MLRKSRTCPWNLFSLYILLLSIQPVYRKTHPGLTKQTYALQYRATRIYSPEIISTRNKNWAPNLSFPDILVLLLARPWLRPVIDVRNYQLPTSGDSAGPAHIQLQLLLIVGFLNRSAAASYRRRTVRPPGEGPMSSLIHRAFTIASGRASGVINNGRYRRGRRHTIGYDVMKDWNMIQYCKGNTMLSIRVWFWDIDPKFSNMPVYSSLFIYFKFISITDPSKNINVKKVPSTFKDTLVHWKISHAIKSIIKYHLWRQNSSIRPVCDEKQANCMRVLVGIHLRES